MMTVTTTATPSGWEQDDVPGEPNTVMDCQLCSTGEMILRDVRNLPGLVIIMAYCPTCGGTIRATH